MTPPQSSNIALPKLASWLTNDGCGSRAGSKPWDALVHVPAERADRPDVVVVPHVAVGDDVEAGFLLIANHRRDGVVVGLFVLHFLERHTDIPAEQLMREPVRTRVRPDHRGGQKRLDDLRCHAATSRCEVEQCGI